MMNGFGGMMGGFGIFTVLFWIALLTIVVWAVARIFPSCTDTKPPSVEGPDPAVEALRVRFARGEIDAEEYRRALEVLDVSPSRPGSEVSVR